MADVSALETSMADVSAWIFLSIGLGGGIALSALFWWYLNHYLVPQITFSQEIAKRPSSLNPSGFMYRIKIKNTGKRRIIDLNVTVRIAIYELGLKKLWNWYNIDISGKKIPMLGKKMNRLIVLRPQETVDFSRDIFPRHVRKKLQSGSLTLEDIMELGNKCYIRLYIFGNDEFSGARKLFCSPKYTRKDIRKGIFRNLTVVAPKKIFRETTDEEVIENDPIGFGKASEVEAP